MLSLPKCEFCKRFHDESYTCDAFPEGIPTEKLWSPEDEECNNGIKFEEE